jgi:ubiquinone/menaquinone biosynthesis C-methylase UbiE
MSPGPAPDRRKGGRMTSEARFWDKQAENYARQPIADEAAYRKKLDIARDYFRPDMQVLEFACGTGTTAIAQAPYVKHIRAIDISEKMIGIARKKAEAAGVRNVAFERADIDSFDAPDGSFDAVMGHSILHLVPDRDAVIARVHRLLRPGGVFISNTACLGDTMLRHMRLIAPMGRLVGLMPLVRVFTSEQLKDSLTRAGFSVAHEWRLRNGPAAIAFIVARKAG